MFQHWKKHKKPNERSILKKIYMDCVSPSKIKYVLLSFFEILGHNNLKVDNP
jgi:hypothetical protein